MFPLRVSSYNEPVHSFIRDTSRSVVSFIRVLVNFPQLYSSFRKSFLFSQISHVIFGLFNQLPLRRTPGEAACQF